MRCRCQKHDLNDLLDHVSGADGVRHTRLSCEVPS